MVELGLQELQSQKREGEGHPFQVVVVESQGPQGLEGEEGFQDHREEGEEAVAFLVLQAREDPQAKGEVVGCL